MSARRRVAVSSPQTRLAHSRRRLRRRWRAPRLDPAEEVRARAQHREQRRIAAGTLAALGALLVLLPAVFAAFPVLDEVRAGAVPLSWLLLGAGPFPVMAGLAWWQLHRAERAERR